MLHGTCTHPHTSYTYNNDNNDDDNNKIFEECQIEAGNTTQY